MNTNMEEIKQMIECRLARVLAIAKAEEANRNDVVIGKHAQGVVDAICGTEGEQKFLEKLLDALR